MPNEMSESGIPLASFDATLHLCLSLEPLKTRPVFEAHPHVLTIRTASKGYGTSGFYPGASSLGKTDYRSFCLYYQCPGNHCFAIFCRKNVKVKN